MTSETQTYLEQAIKDGYAKIGGEGKMQRIHYIVASHSERWSDPEEKVRAEFWAELIYKYQYRPERIGFEVKVPRRTPNDLADLVIYPDKDGELKSPWFVFECKRADVSDAEFAQAIEQACGNRASLGATYAGAISGLTRRLLRFDKFPAGERDKNIMTDIPVRYGKPPEWRFYKNEPGKDLSAIPREELRAAIRKCHQTLWEGGRRSPIAAFGEFCKIIFVKHRDEKIWIARMASPTPSSAAPARALRNWPPAFTNSTGLNRNWSLTFSPTRSTSIRLFWRSAWNTWRAFRSTAPNSTPRAWPSRSSWADFSRAISASTLPRVN